MVPELHLAATYACAHDVPSILKSGESLIGQCLVERRTRILETTEQSGWNIHSGLGSTRPTAVIIAPILLHNAILGVVELATLAMPDETDLEQCDEMTTLLAMNLEILRRNLSIHAMLAEKIVAEQQLEHQLILQQTLLDTIPYPVFYKGADTRFIGVNRAYEETFGITRTSLIGKRVLDLGYLPEADRLAYQAEDEATIASTGTIRRDMKIPFADGQFHDTLYFVAGFRDRDGKPGGLVGTFIEANLVRKSVKQPPAPAVVEAMPMEPIPATLTLDQLVDMDELRKLFSSFCNAIGVPAALIDLQGQVLASSRWQRACTGFHRVHPESCRRCLESDTELALKLEHGTPFTRYTCRNGMTDCASPIIVEGHHLANVFIGQFHIGPPDLEFFMQQARQFGYEEEDYRQAILEAPVMDERKLPVILEFLTGFARMVTTMALARRRSDEAQQRLAQYVELLQRERTVELNP
jgi:PAS domain S-box-containing protein